MLNEAETPITPDQQRGASFLREREEYASSLERIIAQARERFMLSFFIYPLNAYSISQLVIHNYGRVDDIYTKRGLPFTYIFSVRR